MTSSKVNVPFLQHFSKFSVSLFIPLLIHHHLSHADLSITAHLFHSKAKSPVFKISYSLPNDSSFLSAETQFTVTAPLFPTVSPSNKILFFTCHIWTSPLSLYLDSVLIN